MNVIEAPYEHHKFQDMISYGLINSVHKWPSRGDCTPSNNLNRKVSSINLKPSDRSEASPRAPKVRKSSLDPETGSLNKHIDPSPEHFPIAFPGDNTTPIFQLHCFTERKLERG